jgi:UDPglucose 6-dehydrogenase
MRERGARIQAYDPAVEAGDTDPKLEGIEIMADPYAACADAQVLAVLTEWDEFKWLDFDKVSETMSSRRVVDARNLLDRNTLTRRGFEFEGIGRA